jgi:hypothetical protein
MPSDYTGDGAVFTDTIPLCVDSDSPSAQLFRVPVERVLDNTLHARDRFRAAALCLRLIDAQTTNPRPLVLAADNVDEPFVLLFVGDGSDQHIMIPLLAEGVTLTTETLASQTFKGVAADATDLSGRIAGVSDSTSPLHYTDDFGATWTSVSAANSFGGNPGLDIAHNGTLWLAICESTDNAIFSSATAAASSWTSRSLGGASDDAPKRFAVSRTTGRALCVGANGANTAAVMFESADGITWAPVTLPMTADEVSSIAWHPDGFFYWFCRQPAGGFARLYRSPDAGAASWTQVFQSSAFQPRELAIDATTGTMYACEGQNGNAVGRLGVSYDGGLTWLIVTSMVTGVASANGLLVALDATEDKLYSAAPEFAGRIS